MKILVVDDAAITRVMLRMVLQKHGHEVHEAADLTSGLALLFKQKPDFVFTDLNLAGESGLQLFTEITALYPSTPVVLMTASNDERIRKEALSSGMREVLTKPLMPERILELVQIHTRAAQTAQHRISVKLDTALFEQARAQAQQKNQSVEQYIHALVTAQIQTPV